MSIEGRYRVQMLGECMRVYADQVVKSQWVDVAGSDDLTVLQKHTPQNTPIFRIIDTQEKTGKGGD